jgi:hypothetical protein
VLAKTDRKTQGRGGHDCYPHHCAFYRGQGFRAPAKALFGLGALFGRHNQGDIKRVEQPTRIRTNVSGIAEAPYLHGEGMRAAKILSGCTYSPETLETIGKAFDDAWISIAEHFTGDASRAEAARERLAHAVLVAATEASRDSEPIKAMALQIMTSWSDRRGRRGPRSASCDTAPGMSSM